MKEECRKCVKCGSSPIEDSETVLFRFPKPGTTNIRRSESWARYIFPNKPWATREFQMKLYNEHRMLCHRHFKETAFIDYAAKKLHRFAYPEVEVKTFPEIDNVGQPIANPSQALTDISNTLPTSISGPSEINVEIPGSSKTRVIASRMDIEIPSTSKSTIHVPETSGMLFEVPGSLKPSVVTSGSSILIRCKKYVHEIRKLKKKIKYLEKKDRLAAITTNDAVNKLAANISPEFALILQGQLRNYKKMNTKSRKWTLDDKITSLRIYKRSPTCYRLLRRMFSLPCPTTLKVLLRKCTFEVGINKNVFEIVGNVAKSQAPMDNQYVLMFDEMSIRKHFEYNIKKDLIEGFQDHGIQGRTSQPASHALVFMVAGIRQKSKQPMAYYLSGSSVTADRLVALIKEVLGECYEYGINIAVTVCDMDGVNRRSLHILGANVSQPYFENNNRTIFAIFDTPHLIKCFRNLFMKYNIECTVSGIESSDGITGKVSKMTLQRLTALRALMSNQPTALAAYIVPTADAHNSEYISPCDARRQYMSDFTGSAGTAVISAANALVWTDGRYYTQFGNEADCTLWTLMKQSLPETPSMEKWLTSNLSEGAVVGVDPHTMTREEWTPLQTALTKANMQLLAVQNNLVDEVRRKLNEPPPPRPHHEIVPLHIKYTGQSAGDKIKELRKQMVEKKASLLVITALDEVAYTLNLRGSDIEYNPVFYSYLIISPDSVKLFWGDGKLPDNIRQHLQDEGVEVEGLPYEVAVPHLEDIAKSLSETVEGKHSVWISNVASEAIHRAASGSNFLKEPLNLISEVSPVALAKMVKNDVELEGFRQCHIRDGIAVVRLFRWLHKQIENSGTPTEIEIADRLLEFRRDEPDFMGPSFETISGAGENGAIIHYSPNRNGPQRSVTRNDMFLLDSGGQYRDGTTDITRTRHMGTPTAEQKSAFTRVLKGQISLGSALFPKGVKGNVLDSFARKSLWDVGLDYAHGTGHGVGHYLNVHEGPAGISWRPYPHDPGLKPGQILSNEPGYYKVGSFGIRHEDLIETVLVTNDTDHPKAKYLVGDYDGRGVLGFNTLTLVPNQKISIDLHLLDDFELNYINAYHKRVFDTLGPILRKRGLLEDYDWLEKECEPIIKI